MRIMVTGSRTWTDKQAIEDALSYWGGYTLICGGAGGADTLAYEVAKKATQTVEVYRAKWGEFGKAAGPIRNQEMVDSKPDLVLAFWDGRSTGTLDAIKRAVVAGIEVNIYPPGWRRRA